MPAPTPGYVKNMIRRSLREVVDPSPNKRDQKKIWEFFDSRCAYCGKRLDKRLKEGHIDHLVPSTKGGANHISNRVLSCDKCNEKEKLDRPWKEFLIQKCEDKTLASWRLNKILKWIKLNCYDPIGKEFLEKIDSSSKEVITLFDKKVILLRKLKKSKNNNNSV